ncbi:MAG: hypothetical protein DI551_09480 [Micavibrio aeruginosavorus]|uniref:Isochorismatase-like domain-containing protein n=1 Tax=Micavibrio aeruginosavorus TaxID=349221 RepID=A0A2W5MWS4_9BACT|nr:MAG: hypothetical protein DI551_09480 [Micavibrio aeruginosavorus]
MSSQYFMHPIDTPKDFSLMEAFRRKAVAHLIVDIQDLYCDPAHPYVVDSGNDVSRHEALSISLDNFVSGSREILPPIWVVHGVKYIGKTSRYGLMFGEEGRDDPRAFALSSLYNQRVLDTDSILWKSSRDAFHKTDLMNILQERGTEAVIISGLELQACVKQTAISASKKFPTYILEDMVANAMDRDEKIRAGVDSLKPYCGSLTSLQVLAMAT